MPLVTHVADDGGAGALTGAHALGDSPLFQVLPHDLQRALDLSLVARRVSELTLVPGLVIAAADALAPARLPADSLIRAYLGAPGAALASPTEAQRQLFGPERRRAFRWFDPHHPAATGTPRGLEETARAQLGRELFFWDHVAPVAAQAMAALAAETGRPLGFVHRHALDDADVVFIATGATVAAAIAAADHLRARGEAAGVLGVTWLRPFPAAAIRAALGDRARAGVAVVERVAGPTGDAPPPLHASVRAALGAGGERLVSAVAAEIHAERLVALGEALATGDAPRRLRLEARGPRSTGFPRRDALLQAIRGAYPRVDGDRLPATRDGPGLVAGGYAMAVAAHEAKVPADALSLLAAKLHAVTGAAWVRASVRRPEPLAWYARVQGGAAPFADPGPTAPVDALLLLLDDPGDLGQPLDAVRSGGAVFLAAGKPRAALWRTLPARWRDTIGAKGLTVYLVDGDLEAAVAAVIDWQIEGRSSLARLDWEAAAEAAPSEPPIAPILRHIDKARVDFDSLPRFWGEVAGPRRAGLADATPDPLSAGGAVPAYASALEPDPVGAPTLPALDPAACTACGRCWSACPDSALGATVVGVEALFAAASRTAGTAGAAADALRRNHKHLAARASSRLLKTGAERLERQVLDEAWAWLADRLDVAEGHRPAHDEAWAKTADVIDRLAPAVTETFFRGPESERKGAGELFILAMDPRACQGCAICAAVCPEGALTPGDRSRPVAEAARERWSLWERLPDTRGATVDRAKADPRVGPLAGALLCRSVSLAQTGGGVSEPGSGERLAVRLVAGVVEEQAQRRLATIVKTLASERAALDRAAREALSGSLAGVELATLEAAIAEVSAGRADLGARSLRLGDKGARARFDREALLRMTGVAGQLSEHAERLARGADGLGRARFGLVFAKGPLSEWAGRYPRHPYFAPMTVEPTDRGVELARGLVQGLMNDHLTLARSLRRAKVVAAAKPDVCARLAQIDRLRWEDLSADERKGCPPLLFVADARSGGDTGLGRLTRLLSSELPVKVVMLDGRDQLDARPEPALVAMAHRTAFVLAASIAYPDHLAAGVAEALAFDGPAFVHLHAPSPRRLGYPADATLRVARDAVHARAHILFRYDPRAEGAFGQRASLEGNPCPDQVFGEVDFAEWASGLERFDEHFVATSAAGVPARELAQRAPGDRRGQVGTVTRGGERFEVSGAIVAAAARRAEVWRTLREVTGDASTFTGRIRAEVEAELAASAAADRAADEQAHRGELATLRADLEGELTTRLTERLMALAGYSGGEGVGA